MSPDPDESGTLPDDRLLVRPYIAPSVQPEGPTALAWPQTGPVSVAAQLATPSAGSERPPSAPGSAPAAPASPSRAATTFAAATATPSTSASTSAASPSASPPGPPTVADRRSVAGGRLPFVALALLALAAAGALAWLLHEPDEERPRAVAPPGLSVPVLPARSPGAGEEPAPSGDSVGATAPTAPTGAAPTRATTASPTPGPSGASRGAKPSAPSGGAQPSSDGDGTLRPGDRGPEVRALQERLYAQGFTYVSLSGVYDEQTRRGVFQLQRDRSIKGDPQGVYGPATRAAFGSGG
ncbi:peptidoglycan-binding protein [Streptomyces sp. ISL-66]|uniref:peptidoglycan-binding domain-containing protein n=1 Tax=Streptomyces sp. ISL-66 TaxID=2819186 RepID=UPI001BECC4A2|nr:peptidoglycan-binding domain-containing protein [Streptomyces sp. ISL-66]MBT2472744.1 peptidoglycan-binding protein [Streptomyces sp. ISL-66]